MTWLMVHLGWKGDRPQKLQHYQTKYSPHPSPSPLLLPCDPVPLLWTFSRQALTARHSCWAGRSPHGSTEGAQAAHGCPMDLFLQLLMMDRLHPPVNPLQPSACPSPCPSPFLLSLQKARPGSKQMPQPGERMGALPSPGQPICVTHSFHPIQHLLRWSPSSISKAEEECAVVHAAFVLVVLHRFQHLEGFLGSCNPLAPSPNPTAPHKKARSVFRVQSPVLLLFPSPKCPKSGTGTCCSQAPQKPLSNNAVRYPAPFPGSALSQEPQIWPQGAGTTLHVQVWQPHSPPPPAHASHRNHQAENGSGLGNRQCLPRKRCDAGGERKENVVHKRQAFQSLFRIQTGPSLSLQGGTGCPNGSVRGEAKNRECHKGRGWICCLLDLHTSHSFPPGSRRNT